jgi:hypothetical protein
MWLLEKPAGGVTNKVTIPTDGMILVTVQPPSTKVHAYINDQEAKPLDRLYGRAGDVVYFEIKGSRESDSTVTIQYGDNVDTLQVVQRPPKMDVATSEEGAYDGTEINQGNMMNPMETVNLFANPGAGMGGALGGGLGAGLVGGILGTALLGRGGLGGLNGVDGVVGAPATLQGVESVVNNAAIMSQLADVKAAVPLAEGQIQLALAGAQMDLNNSISQSSASNIAAVSSLSTNLMNNLNMQTQMNQKGFADTAATVVAQGTTNLLATKDAATQALQSSWLLNQAITSDGDKTRALIQSIDKTNDSRLITQLANEVSELRNEGRLRVAEGNITISNTNTAQAVAQQQQSQQQQQQLAVLGAHLQALYQQNQHIQQGVLNIGSGTVSGNSQNAANTRVS